MFQLLDLQMLLFRTVHLHSFKQRINKLQPIVAPSDIKDIS